MCENEIKQEQESQTQCINMLDLEFEVVDKELDDQFGSFHIQG